jgi:hypothetical protein
MQQQTMNTPFASTEAVFNSEWLSALSTKSETITSIKTKNSTSNLLVDSIKNPGKILSKFAVKKTKKTKSVMDEPDDFHVSKKDKKDVAQHQQIMFNQDSQESVDDLNKIYQIYTGTYKESTVYVINDPKLFKLYFKAMKYGLLSTYGEELDLITDIDVITDIPEVDTELFEESDSDNDSDSETFVRASKWLMGSSDTTETKKKTTTKNTKFDTWVKTQKRGLSKKQELILVNICNTGFQDGKIIADNLLDKSSIEPYYQESKILLYALKVSFEDELSYNVLMFSHLFSKYTSVMKEILPKLVEYYESFQTNVIMSEIIKADHLIQKVEKIKTLPGQLEMMSILERDTPALILNKGITNSGKTASIIVSTKILNKKFCIYFCKHNNVMHEVGRKQYMLGIRPTIVKNNTYYSCNGVVANNLAKYITECAKTGFIPKSFIVVDIQSFLKILDELNGNGIDETINHSQTNKEIIKYNSTLENVVVLWDEPDIDSSNGAATIQVLRKLIDVPKLVLASATLPFHQNSPFVLDWKNRHQTELEIINPPCVTLGITCIDMSGKLIMYHDNCKTKQELLDKLEQIKKSPLLQKMYTGDIAMTLYNKACELSIEVISPKDFFQKIEDITITKIREYIYHILERVSESNEIISFCERMTLDTNFDPGKLVSECRMGTTLIPSFTSEEVPERLLQKHLERVSQESLDRFIQLYYKTGKTEKVIYKKTSRGVYMVQKKKTSGQKRYEEEQKSSRLSELDEIRELINANVINGFSHFQRRGIRDYHYVRDLDDQTIDKIHSLKAESKLLRALMLGCAYYNGGSDSYSAEVLRQLNSKSMSKHPAIVAMSSCVGTNFPFSTVYINKKYSVSTPSEIFQAISRVSRLGKETLSGRAVLAEEAEQKLFSFFTDTQTMEERVIESLYVSSEIKEDNVLDLLDDFDF